MEIPTDDDGMFEVVDGAGVVVGHGIVSVDDVVDFAYTDGTLEGQVVLPREEFVALWESLRLGAGLTIRAAT